MAGSNSIQLAPLWTEMKIDLTGFNREIDKAITLGKNKAKELSNKLDLTAAGKKIESLGNKLTKLSAPIIGLGTSCVKMAYDSEESFAKVSTIIDTNVLSIDKLKEGVKQASNETGIAITDFNEALYQSVSAGIDSGNAIAFTTQMNKLAKGGFTDIAKAVDVVTSVLNAYEMKTEEATNISDKLIMTQNLGKTTVDELASSMGKLIPTAKAYNVNIDNVCTSLATMTKGGIPTAESTTYLNSMLVELGKSSTVVSTKLKELSGKSFQQLSNDGKSLAEILKILDDDCKKNGKSLNDLFGSAEAGRGAMALLSEEGKVYDSILKEMTESAGATDKAFKKMDDTPLQKFKKAMNELKNAGIDFGNILIPYATKFTVHLTNIAQKLQNLSDGQKKFIVEALGSIALLGPVLSIGGKILQGISKVKTGLLGLKTAFGVTATATQATTTALVPFGAKLGSAFTGISGAAAKTGLLSKALIGLTSPIGIAIAGFGLLALGVSNNFGGIRDTIFECMEKIKNAISTAVSFIRTLWESDFGGIREFTTLVFNSIKTFLDDAFRVIGDLLTLFTDLFTGNWSNLWEDVKNLFNNGWTLIVNTFGNFINIIVTGLLNSVVSFINAGQSIIQGLWNGMSWVWANVTSWFNQIVHEPYNTLYSLVSWFSNLGSNIINSLWNGLRYTWSSVSNWFTEKVNWIKDKLNIFNSTKAQMDGSHYNGLDFVPFDGYVARLHKGERILTAEENRRMVQTGGLGEGQQGGTFIIKNYMELDGKIIATSTNKVLGNETYLKERGLSY